MTSKEKAAVINARCATALIRAMGMQAENQDRLSKGYSIAYTENAFENVIVEEGTSWNDIHGVLYNG